jgi:hypothetical protein
MKIIIAIIMNAAQCVTSVPASGSLTATMRLMPIQTSLNTPTTIVRNNNFLTVVFKMEVFSPNVFGKL